MKINATGRRTGSTTQPNVSYVRTSVVNFYWSRDKFNTRAGCILQDRTCERDSLCGKVAERGLKMNKKKITNKRNGGNELRFTRENNFQFDNANRSFVFRVSA